MAHHSSPSPRRRAFTLVELLIVIGIIAVLMGITLPAIAVAHKHAQRAKCYANLHGLGVALTTYSTQNAGTLPYQQDLFVLDFNSPTARPSVLRLLGKQMHETGNFYCPSVLKTDNSALQGGRATDLSDTSYAVNGALLGLNLAQLKRGSSLIYIQELAERVSTAHLRPTQLAQLVVSPKPQPGTFTLWHDSEVFVDPAGKYKTESMSVAHGNPPLLIGGNLLFVDGHVEYRRAATLRSSDFGLTPDEGLNGFNSVLPSSGGQYKLKL
ncbi:MAG TPA: type II secretion system protein [Humisphaera sp.]